MHVLVVHNRYRQRGGEDVVVEHEAELLRTAGHTVTEYVRHNDEIQESSPWQASLGALWNPQTVRDLGALLAQARPDVVHVHNTFARVSPSVYWAAAQAGVPVVQTLHNFRLVCPQALLLRDGKPCEACVGRLPWAGVRHGCYRGSRTQTAVAAASVVFHRALGTWQHKVDRYIALSEFSRQRFLAGGIPAERIVVKPNSVPPPAAVPAGPKDGLLYVGRLAAEKGIDTLRLAVAGLPQATVRVAGAGPLADHVAAEAAFLPLGYLDRDRLASALGRSVALVLPGHCYENSPLAVLEAYAAGVPVIASRLGALEEVVEDGVTGLLVAPGDPGQLRSRIDWALAHPHEMAAMGQAARLRHERLYSPQVNLRQLIAIYDSVRAAGTRMAAPAAAQSLSPGETA